MEPRYHYFAMPHEFSTYTPEPHHCDLCGGEAPGYEGPFYGTKEVDFVCEECMMAGRLKDVHASTNDPDANALREQLQVKLPNQAEKKRENLMRSRSDEVAYATPPLETWQDFSWPAHCADYCRFLKEVGQPELNEAAPDGNGFAFFRTHTTGLTDEEHAREVWDQVREDRPENGAEPYAVGVYLFQCRECGEYVMYWDEEQPE